MEFLTGVDDEIAVSRSLFNTEKKLVFDPLVYEQRYLKVCKILNHERFKQKLKTFLEFGCAEMKFFTYFKNSIKHATQIDMVDIDGQLLEKSKSRVEPLINEHVNRRPVKLTVNIWKGNVAVSNVNFKNVDAVIAIELIEHVFPDVLDEIPFHIFGIVKPKIAVFTTPNGEFNVLFNMKPGDFRHDDHKFEWTRDEFQDWSNNICDRFPDYCVQFHGVGNAPEGFENLGSCSQLGLFIRKDFLACLDVVEDEETKTEEQEEPEQQKVTECPEYQLIESIVYPFFHDTRNRDEKILDECSYHINRFRWMEEEYFNYDADRFEIPLSSVANACWEITDNIDEIRSILKGKFLMEKDFLIFPPNDEEFDDEEEEEEFDLSNAPKAGLHLGVGTEDEIDESTSKDK